MYTTAHRVRSRDDQIGINSFLYEHGADESGVISWDLPDVVAVADGYNGVLVAQSYDVPLGGNMVLSYLDVVTADGTELDRITRELGAFISRVERKTSPIVAVINGIGMRFGCILGLVARAPQEFDELRNRVLAMLRAGRQSANQDAEPMEVQISFDETGYSFELTPESAARILEAHRNGSWRSSRFHVKPDVMMNFQTMHGDLIPHVIAGLTRLRLEEVIRMGGMVFISKTDGRELLRWPRAAGI